MASRIVRWVQRVEKENKLPIDRKRRWIIATLLGIPPASFGLQALPMLIPALPAGTIPQTTVPSSLDSRAALARVKTLWSSWSPMYEQQPSALFAELISSINTIEQTYIYDNQERLSELAHLLCQYLLLFANILRDQGYLQSALVYIEKAIAVAKNHDLHENLAKALYLHGYILFDQWGIQPQQENQNDLRLATNDFSSALQLVEKQQNRSSFENLSLHPALLAELGLAQAYQMQDQDDRRRAFRLLDQSEQLVYAPNFQRDWFFLHVNAEWARIDKAEALVAVHWPKAALDHLDDSHKGAGPLRRRYVYTDIIEARAHLMQGHLDVGVAYLENALAGLEGMQAFTFLAIISKIHGEMKQHKVYKTSPEVARLGVKILQAAHPDIFR
jgi:hypothetical protein